MLSAQTVEWSLRELRSGLFALYGDRLRGAYLFGSYARHEADAESDLDVLVVLADFDRYGAEIARTGQLVSDLSLAVGVSVSPVLVREYAWLAGESPFLAHARADAITV